MPLFSCRKLLGPASGTLRQKKVVLVIFSLDHEGKYLQKTPAQIRTCPWSSMNEVAVGFIRKVPGRQKQDGLKQRRKRAFLVSAGVSNLRGH